MGYCCYCIRKGPFSCLSSHFLSPLMDQMRLLAQTFNQGHDRASAAGKCDFWPKLLTEAITDAKHRQTILASAAHVAEVNRYNYVLKTGKVKAARNPGGFLLVRLGLVAAKAAAVAK